MSLVCSVLLAAGFAWGQETSVKSMPPSVVKTVPQSGDMDGVDPMVGQAIADAQKLQSDPPFSGKLLWDNGIRFTVAGEPVKNVSNEGIRAAFNSKNIPITAADIHKLSAFIGKVASKAAQFKDKSIDLMNVLQQIRKTK